MKLLHRNFLLLIFLALLTTSFSCKVEGIGSDKMDTMRENRWKWIKSAIFDYEVDESLNCFCVIAGKHHLVVVDDHVVSATNSQGEAVANPAQHFKTIDQLFKFIEESLKKNPARADITYDSTYGYPKSIYIDFDERMADEEMGYELSNFEKK
ncbi:DUF6174 domain-containing protein [Desertivirga brevis]|uniref:DUF6174 domain-containing protein n=1 Tax=Desertivirga brevis TaxID=2810310 RepID=UPI001A9760BE|nr:DUF6174 domain-containing protein [Pedobacter sp. SYSU D00873]